MSSAGSASTRQPPPRPAEELRGGPGRSAPAAHGARPSSRPPGERAPTAPSPLAAASPQGRRLSRAPCHPPHPPPRRRAAVAQGGGAPPAPRRALWRLAPGAARSRGRRREGGLRGGRCAAAGSAAPR